MSAPASPPEPDVTQALAADHGLKPDEYQRILDLLGRTPSFTELGIFSAMWNEHCSVLEFVEKGGKCLGAYPRYQKVTLEKERYRVADTKITRMH
ncbi:MAG: hypothetical protein AAF908_00720, partial [Pseudomonadota bacterium]